MNHLQCAPATGAERYIKPLADVGVFSTGNANYLRLTGTGKDDGRLFNVRISTGAAEVLAQEIGGLLHRPLVGAMQHEFMSPTVKQDHHAERGEHWEETKDVARLARQTDARTWLIRQLEAWPTRVDPEQTTNVGYLMQEAAKALRSEVSAHPDDLAVDAFAARMKAKLACARARGRAGWDDPAQCTVETLRTMLHDHVAKGDPVDVANFCMMLDHYGASTSIVADPSAVVPTPQCKHCDDTGYYDYACLSMDACRHCAPGEPA